MYVYTRKRTVGKEYHIRGIDVWGALVARSKQHYPPVVSADAISPSTLGVYRHRNGARSQDHDYRWHINHTSDFYSK